MEISTSKCKPIFYNVKGFTDATVFKDTLVLLKKDTLFFISSKNHFQEAARFISLKMLFPNLSSFETVRVDASNTIWLSGKFSGLYSITKGKLLERLNVPVINVVKTSADTSIWVGTNLGLYKYTEKLNSWQKYSEEALGGYDMPDNIVEHIYADNTGCAWVTMPSYISYISKVGEEEIPSFNYLGDAQTELLDVQLLKTGYLMATNKGLIYISRIVHEAHTSGEEIHTQTSNNSAIIIARESIQTPAELSAETVTYLGKDKKLLYFFTQKGYWTIQEKKLF